MKKQFIFCSMIAVTLLTGCASYKAPPLSNLTVEAVNARCENTGIEENVVVIAKQFNQLDCKKFLDRDVLAKGYQPIQLFILNNSDKNYLFSLNRINMPCASSEEVARTVHTSTVGRAVGYGVAALFLWPLAIPAIVDGVKSANANAALDSDFADKSARDQIIATHSCFNKIIFIPLQNYQPSFNIGLMDLESNTTHTLNVVAK